MSKKDEQKDEQGVCPHCGYCPHCGRSNDTPRYVPYPVYPIAPIHPVIPPWMNPHRPIWYATPTDNTVNLPVVVRKAEWDV